MDWKLLVTVFSTIFVAEIGDKTQLATILYASGAEYGKLTVFLGSSLALVSTSALGVLVGASLAQFLNPKYSKVTGTDDLKSKTPDKTMS